MKNLENLIQFSWEKENKFSRILISIISNLFQTYFKEWKIVIKYYSKARCEGLVEKFFRKLEYTER
jgi:hypothetical protein